MSFHASASDIRVDEGHILRARVRNVDGEEVDAELDLDTCLGNNNGRFEWGGACFSHTAEGISFSMEGDGDVPVLRACLQGQDGKCDADVNLSERISNENGILLCSP